MNIELSAADVRIRITRNELQTLRSSRAITLDVKLPRNHALRFNIRPAVIGGWSLDSDPTGTWIAIPRTDLDTLAESLPSQEGLEHSFEISNGGSVRVSVELGKEG